MKYDLYANYMILSVCHPVPIHLTVPYSQFYHRAEAACIVKFSFSSPVFVLKPENNYLLMECKTHSNIFGVLLGLLMVRLYYLMNSFMISFFFLWLFDPFRGHFLPFSFPQSLLSLAISCGHFLPFSFPQSLLSLAISCHFFILSSLVPSYRLASHLFLSFPVGLLLPRPSSRICFGIPL